MSTAVLPAPAECEGISLELLEDLVRRNLNVRPNEGVRIQEVQEHSNLNYVYRATFGGQSLYLKHVPERPKKLPIKLPQSRIYGEADAMEKFRACAGTNIVSPKVLFVDAEHFVLGMTDVGMNRSVLIDVLADQYRLFVGQAHALGRGLAAVHSQTRGMKQFRPEGHDEMLRGVVFQGLIAPGAKAVFPDLADKVLIEMKRHRECLVHADLWGKNILVGQSPPPAVVDFEGASLGDPAFDVATLLAVSLIPALQKREWLPESLAFTRVLLSYYREAHESRDWANAILGRAFFYTGSLLAARGFGPFAYPMTDSARARLGVLALELTARPPATLTDYVRRVHSMT